MALPLISANLPPNIDVTKATLAFGLRALPRLNRELKDPTLLVRQRAVKSLVDYLHDHEHTAAALEEGIVDSLKKLLEDPDITCRQLAAECFFVISQHAIGRQAFLDEDIITPLAALFDDTEDICRRNAHLALEIVSETPIGAEGIVDAGLIPVLIKKMQSELDEIKLYILDTLHFCCVVNTVDALKTGGMEAFTALLSHPLPTIRAKAARVIADISVPLEGKDKAVDVETIPALVNLLNDANQYVRANATSALGFICITTQAKYTAVGLNAISFLLPLIDDENSEVRVNVLKVITCLAEAPEGRRVIIDHKEDIVHRQDDPIPAVRKHADIAIKVINWMP